MKVLISAVACNPYLGSENYFGWAAVQALARDHDLWVLTSPRNQADLTRAQSEGLVPPNVRFVYAGGFKEWNPHLLKARIQSWKEYHDYSRAALPVARDLCRTVKLDLVHHVTFATWRVALPFWKLDMPFILGPIGGNEKFPFRIFPLLSPIGAAFETLRKVSNMASRVSPGVRQSIRGAARILAATTETEQLVKSIRGTGNGIFRLLPGFYSAAQVAAFSRFAPGKEVNGPLRLFASGNLGAHKGLGMAFQAVARAKRNGVKLRYLLGAKGPEIPHLRNLAVRLGLQNEIIFGDTMSREDYARELGGTHVYLLPSLRESVGLTMMEAMLAGCVPIVADCGGPNFIVTPECGYKLKVTTPGRMICEMAEIIQAIDRDRSIISEKGSLASQRIGTHFSEANYRKTVNEVYLSVAKERI